MTLPSSALNTLLAAAVLLAAACGGDREAPAVAAPEGEPESGGTAIFAERSDMSKPMPLLFETALDGDLSEIMYMSLLRGAWAEGRLVYQTSEQTPMAMAHGYELVGPDSTTVRFRMRSGLRWSDGHPITARDVAFTYRLLADPAVASPRQDWTANLDSVVAENDSTAAFHFARRYPDMLLHASHTVVPEHVFARYDRAALQTSGPVLRPADSLVVSGPFRVGAWQPRDRITLVPNPHFLPRPHLDAIVIRVIPEPTTRLTELQTGAVDFTRPVPFEQMLLLQQQSAASGVRFESEEKRQYDYVAYNPGKFAPFADPEIRRALGLAIDVPGILRALGMEAHGVPAAGPYSPIFKDLAGGAGTRPLPFDTARARQILASRGWRDTDGDGFVDKGGKPFRFTLTTNTGNQRRADVSQIIQQQWRLIGVDAQLRQQEWNTLFGRMMERDYEAVLGGWQVGLSPDIGAFYEDGAPFNVVDYRSPEVTQLIRAAREQPTEAAAAPMWRAAAARVVADQPYTWLYYLDQVDALGPRLRGMKVDTYGAFQNPWQWWIPRARQGGAPRTAVAAAVPGS